MNKYRLSMVIVLFVMIILYMLNIVCVSEITNFAFTSSSLLLSISSTMDTYADNNKLEERIRFVIDTLAVAVAILLPSLKNVDLIQSLMNNFDANLLLLLSLFFTLLSQWATEIKWKDLQNKK